MLLDLLGFIQSDDSRCGVASIKSVLYYYGLDYTEDQIAIACKHSYELGCTNEDMVNALQIFGLGAGLYKNGSIEDLKYWNQHHVPVIVDFFTPGVNNMPSDMPNGHSGIIVNVDRCCVHLLDPEDGKIRQIEHSEFERVWFDWAEVEKIEKDTVLDLGCYIVTYPKRLILNK